MGTARTTTGTTPDGTSATSALCLHVVRGATVATHPLPASGTVVVGRTRDADVVIPDVSMSRRHAAIHIGPPHRIEDLASKNGVRVGDRTIGAGEQAEIAPGTVIECGDVMLVLQHTATAKRSRRVWSHGYFEARVEDECARAGRLGGSSVVARLHVGRLPEDRANEILARTLR